MTGDPTTVLIGTNLIGVVETPRLDAGPVVVDVDGRPYLPTASAGVVLGVELGDSAFGFDADHVAPGATLIHPDQAARHALTAFACLGNRAVVRSGAASGAVGRVVGKRGELGRVLVTFAADALARLLPADSVAVHGYGQGLAAPLPGIRALNVDPALLAALPVRFAERAEVSVRGRVPSRLVGNGFGRPAEMWDLDLQLDAQSAAGYQLAGLALGDLVCVDDLDVRHNAGFRRGWLTVGVVVHGSSRQPGHGPGIVPILAGPADLFRILSAPDDHVGMTASMLGLANG